MSNPQERAFLALWNSISSPRVALEYETWHTFEHVPERVGLPGFLQARRYRAVDEPTHYFTCYWVASLDTFSTPEYQAVFTHPTPWSARMRLELRDFFRMPCTMGSIYGNSSASMLATLRLCSAAPAFVTHLDSCLRQMVNLGRFICAQWGLSAPSNDFPLPNVELGPAGSGQDFVIMLQHFDAQALRNSTEALLQSVDVLVTSPVQTAYFELLTQVRQDELTNPLGERQPARTNLFEIFNPKETL